MGVLLRRHRLPSSMWHSYIGRLIVNNLLIDAHSRIFGWVPGGGQQGSRCLGTYELVSAITYSRTFSQSLWGRSTGLADALGLDLASTITCSRTSSRAPWDGRQGLLMSWGIEIRLYHYSRIFGQAPWRQSVGLVDVLGHRNWPLSLPAPRFLAEHLGGDWQDLLMPWA